MIKFKNSPLNMEDYQKHSEGIKKLHLAMEEGRAAGSDYLGWLYYASSFDKNEVDRIKTHAKKIRDQADVLVVAGIGGSYLGADAIIRALELSFGRSKPEIIFCGNNLSGAYLEELISYLDGKNFYVNVISKSGRTLETALAFRFLKDLLIEKHGSDYYKYIYATTDSSSGALRKQVEEEGFVSFEVPGNVGGRFSVMTPVGLFPLAVAGLNIDEFLEGFIEGEKDFSSENLIDNLAYQYGLVRNHYYNQGKLMEILVTYEPALGQFAEWFKQLFGESEGKDGRGIFPISVANTTDLHSLGQIIQDGKKIFFETVLDLTKKTSLSVPSSHMEDDLGYLEGERVGVMTKNAQLATLIAHEEAGVPNLILELDDYSERGLGYLMYFMMRACAMTSYLQGVNPFDQPGVEAYKTNMLALMGNPSYAQYRQALVDKLVSKGLI